MRAPQLLTSGSPSSFNRHNMLCIQIMKYQEICQISWFQENYSISWGSLVSEMVKNPPAMRETWVWSLDWKDPLEEGMATHPSILAWRIPMDRGAWRATVYGVAKSQTRLSNWTPTHPHNTHKKKKIYVRNNIVQIKHLYHRQVKVTNFSHYNF